MFDVSTSLLRFWESEFRYLNPKKSRRGDRQYTKKDIERIHEIYELVKVQGYTLDGAKKAIKDKSAPKLASESDFQILIRKLEDIKKGLHALKISTKP